MCQSCEELIKQVPEKVIDVLNELTAEAEAYGAKIMPKLIEAGVIVMLPKSFTEEEIASGKDKRIAALFGLAAIAGYATNVTYHNATVAIGAEEIFEAVGKIGWAVGHVMENTVKN